MAENAIKGTNDSDNIVQIMAGQETGDSQQLAIMEAIAAVSYTHLEGA